MRTTANREWVIRPACGFTPRHQRGKSRAIEILGLLQRDRSRDGLYLIRELPYAHDGREIGSNCGDNRHLYKLARIRGDLIAFPVIDGGWQLTGYAGVRAQRNHNRTIRSILQVAVICSALVADSPPCIGWIRRKLSNPGKPRCQGGRIGGILCVTPVGVGVSTVDGEAGQADEPDDGRSIHGVRPRGRENRAGRHGGSR